MAHFKLLQYPLRKTKGSVLLSTVKYTQPPSSTSALPWAPSQTFTAAHWVQSRLDNGEGWGSLQWQFHSQKRGLLPGLEWWKPPPPGRGAQTWQAGGSSDAAHTLCGFPVSVTCSMLVFSYSIFSWLPTSYRIPGKATFTRNPSASNLPPLVYVYKGFCTVSFAWKIGYVIKESY